MVPDRRLLAATLRTGSLVACFATASVAVVAFLLDVWLRPLTAGAVGLVGLSGPLPRLLLTTLLLTPLLLWASSRAAASGSLSALDAKTVSDDERPDLHRRLTRLAAGLDVPTPRLAVVDHDAPNSLTVEGSEPTIVLTTGLLDRLDDDELDAVIAHELAHLRNHDGRVLTLASLVPKLVVGDAGASTLGKGGRLLAGGGLLALGYLAGGAYISAPVFSGAYTLAFLLALSILLLVGGVVLGVLALGVALSGRGLVRTRVLAADRAAAAVAGSPAALASALVRVEEYDGPPLPVPAGTDALCLAPVGLPDEARLSLRAQPSLDERLAELRDQTAAVEGSSVARRREQADLLDSRN